MLNSEFNEFAENKSLDLYPKALRSQIDAVNEWVGKSINSGVYKVGNAANQAEYDKVCLLPLSTALFYSTVPLSSEADLAF